jgi:hypothetical protein
VIVWETGTYRNRGEGESIAEALERGHASFPLEGQKLRGGSTLHRTRGGRKPKWLLIERRDECADAAATRSPRSRSRC